MSDPSNTSILSTITSAEATRAATYKTAAATYAAGGSYGAYIATRQAADTLCQTAQDNARDSVRGTYLAR
jgi:hypothetical protein